MQDYLQAQHADFSYVRVVCFFVFCFLFIYLGSQQGKFLLAH